MIESARNLAEGHDRPPLVALGGEFRELSNAFNDMAAQVDNRHRRLQETVDRRSTVLGAMEEGVIAVDSRQRILFANPAAGKLLGFDSKLSVGKQMLEVIRNHMLHEAVSKTLVNQDVQHKKLKRYELNADQSAIQSSALIANNPIAGRPMPRRRPGFGGRFGAT